MFLRSKTYFRAHRFFAARPFFRVLFARDARRVLRALPAPAYFLRKSKQNILLSGDSRKRG